MIWIPFLGWGLRGIYNSEIFEKLDFWISETFDKYCTNSSVKTFDELSPYIYVTIILFHICKSCKILQVMITIYTLSVTQNVVGKNANRNFCYHKSCWNRCSNNDFWNSCSNNSCWNHCFNKSCWNSHQRNFVPAIIGGTVVPTMIVGTTVQQSLS